MSEQESSTSSKVAKSKNAVINYFQESIAELGKVTWPTRNQAVKMTAIVLGFCLVASIVIGALDLAFNEGYKLVVDYANKVNPAPAIQEPVDTNAPITTPEINITPEAIKTTDGSGANVNVTPVDPSPAATPAAN